jgi:hypothetical protein
VRFLPPTLPLVLALAACSSTGVPPPAGPDAAVVVADVRVTGSRADAATTYPRKVLFVRFGEDDAIEEFAWSNYHRGTRVYLFNATPGRWAMACAVPFVDGKNHYVFLPEGVVRGSRADVPEGGVVSLGTAVVNESVVWNEADPMQKRVRHAVLKRRPKPNAWQTVFPNLVDFRGEYGRHTPDDGSIAADARDRIRRWGWDR